MSVDVYQAIITAVGSVGFPIVCSLILLKQNKDITDKHAQESTAFQEALGDLKTAITQLADKLG